MFDGVVDGVVDVVETLGPVVADLDVDALDPEAAADLVGLFVRVEQLAAAGRVLATRAVAGGEAWRREGFRSAAAWMASQAGMPVGTAIATMEMAGLLDDLPAVAAAFRSGGLSEAQAREIADAAAECPAAQEELLDAAQRLSFKGLREECRRVKAAAVTDEKERYRRIHRDRHVRGWVDRHGVGRLSTCVSPDALARVLGKLETRCDEIVVEARAGGWYESREAHLADALVDLICTGDGTAAGGSSDTMIHVMVDYEALIRGRTVPGERCEIPGVGPIPVTVARHRADNAIFKILLTKGVDITAVAHAGRHIPAHLRTALECRDPKCIVPRCDQRRGLEIDHRDPHAATGDTSLANTARLCRWHHYQKSHLGYTYRGGPGTWKWIAPDIATEPPIYPP